MPQELGIVYSTQYALCDYYVFYYYGHFIFPWIFYFTWTTKKMNFTPDNYELKWIIPHTYGWSIVWTWNKKKDTCSQRAFHLKAQINKLYLNLTNIKACMERRMSCVKMVMWILSVVLSSLPTVFHRSLTSVAFILCLSFIKSSVYSLVLENCIYIWQSKKDINIFFLKGTDLNSYCTKRRTHWEQARLLKPVKDDHNDTIYR